MGTAKHALPFGHQTMLERAIATLRQVVSPIVVVAAPNQSLPELPSDVLIARDPQEFQGPLAGLSVGLSALKPYCEAAYVSACDVPLLKPEFVSFLVNALGEFEIVVPHEAAFHHPLAAVYRTSLVDRIEELLSNKQMRPLFLIKESRSLEIDVDELRVVDADLESLRNTNTRDEYMAALRDAGLSSE